MNNGVAGTILGLLFGAISLVTGCAGLSWRVFNLGRRIMPLPAIDVQLKALRFLLAFGIELGAVLGFIYWVLGWGAYGFAATLALVLSFLAGTSALEIAAGEIENDAS